MNNLKTTEKSDKQTQSTKPKLRYLGFCGKVSIFVDIVSSIAKEHPDATSELFPKLIDEELMRRNCKYHKFIKETAQGVVAKFSLRDSEEPANNANQASD